MTFLTRLSERLSLDLDHPSPAVKQSATAIAVVAASILTLLVPGLGFSNTFVAVWGIAIIAFATMLSLVFTRVDSLEHYALLIPIIDRIEPTHTELLDFCARMTRPWASAPVRAAAVVSAIRRAISLSSAA